MHFLRRQHQWQEALVSLLVQSEVWQFWPFKPSTRPKSAPKIFARCLARFFLWSVKKKPQLRSLSSDRTRPRPGSSRVFRALSGQASGPRRPAGVKAPPRLRAPRDRKRDEKGQQASIVTTGAAHERDGGSCAIAKCREPRTSIRGTIDDAGRGVEKGPQELRR